MTEISRNKKKFFYKLKIFAMHFIIITYTNNENG